MDNYELKRIVKKHRFRSLLFYTSIIFMLILISLYNKDYETVSVWAYAGTATMIGLAVIFIFVEGVLVDVLKRYKSN